MMFMPGSYDLSVTPPILKNYKPSIRIMNHKPAKWFQIALFLTVHVNVFMVYLLNRIKS